MRQSSVSYGIADAESSRIVGRRANSRKLSCVKAQLAGGDVGAPISIVVRRHDVNANYMCKCRREPWPKEPTSGSSVRQRHCNSEEDPPTEADPMPALITSIGGPGG